MEGRPRPLGHRLLENKPEVDKFGLEGSGTRGPLKNSFPSKIKIKVRPRGRIAVEHIDSLFLKNRIKTRNRTEKTHADRPPEFSWDSQAKSANVGGRPPA